MSYLGRFDLAELSTPPPRDTPVDELLKALELEHPIIGRVAELSRSRGLRAMRWLADGAHQPPREYRDSFADLLPADLPPADHALIVGPMLRRLQSAAALWLELVAVREAWLGNRKDEAFATLAALLAATIPDALDADTAALRASIVGATGGRKPLKARAALVEHLRQVRPEHTAQRVFRDLDHVTIGGWYCTAEDGKLELSKGSTVWEITFSTFARTLRSVRR